MEPEMDSLQLQDNCEHQMYSEASHASDVIHDDPPVGPFIGSEHQAEIPNLATEDERCQLRESSLYSYELHGFDFPDVIGLSIPVKWESQPPSEANKEDEKLQTCHFSESESRNRTRDKESQLASICSNCNDTSECYPSNQDRHVVLPVGQIEPEGNQVYDEKLDPCFNQECLNLTGRPMVQQRETEQFAPLPGSSTSLWTALEEECFLLGLYIFGKNLNVLSKFVESRRQQELISRLKSKISKEGHDSLLEVFKSFSDGQTSLEECVFTLKSTTGTETFLEVIGIDPSLLDLEVDGTDNGATVHKNGWAIDQDDPLEDGDKELPKFTIIDTSLVQVGECFKVREFRSLPVESNISFGSSNQTVLSQPKIETNATRNAKEKMVTSLIGPNKPETLPDNETSMSIHMISSEKHGCAMVDEAPSISNSEMIPDVLGAVGKPDVTFQWSIDANTRNVCKNAEI
ncbi:hypothetical protein GUJ93_ZPchr0003g18027 [Zizania palustris]|uniref:DUF7952 domain-containing protein n=1 Tax=Zizania palustris TaxID=103762 RepID=A0A8J5VXW5_ZIZPA|nr:hypothetical protein GUJ93_ZPchr0003g18027 [Zizania palustris]